MIPSKKYAIEKHKFGDLIMVIIFGIAAALAAQIKVHIPGTPGGVTDARELFTITGIIFARKWWHALLIGILASFGGPYGALGYEFIRTLIMHSVAIPGLWFVYRYSAPFFNSMRKFAFWWFLVVLFVGYGTLFSLTFTLSQYILPSPSVPFIQLYQYFLSGVGFEALITALITSIVISFLKAESSYQEKLRTKTRELQHSELLFRSTFEQAAVGIAHLTLDGHFIRMNRRYCEITGYPQDELIKMKFHDITHPEDVLLSNSYTQQLMNGERASAEFEKRYITMDGETRWITLTVARVIPIDEEPPFLVSVIQDITDRKNLEQELQHTQKMEAIGRLAGGVAHDFNNLLTIIGGNAELLDMTLPEESELREYIKRITETVENAGSLTSQLLAFSRQKTARPASIDIEEAITELQKMLSRLLTDRIDFHLALSGKSPRIFIDPVQFQQIIMNLVVNARDAMGDGGTLTIATAVDSGEVTLEVRDTGTGMDETILDHVYEPFFTTKEEGQGTGLGLSTVYSIVQEANGEIGISSSKGEGTTVQIRFALHTEDSESRMTATAPSAATRNGTVLLIDDNAEVLKMLGTILSREGYRVESFANGNMAVEHMRHKIKTIDLVITDIMMPGLSGHDVARWCLERRPDMPLILMSGYSEAIHRNPESEKHTILEKPFTINDLLFAIDRTLDLKE